MESIKINKWVVVKKNDKVEFWYLENKNPRFIARYHLNQMIVHGNRPLSCDNLVPEWTVKSYEMVAVIGWLKTFRELEV